MAQTTYQKIEEYIDLMAKNGYSAHYILQQLAPIRVTYYDGDICGITPNVTTLQNRAKKATGNLEVPVFLLSDFLQENKYPKPTYLSDLNIHPVVRRFFEALHNLIPDYELYLDPPSNPNEFVAIEKYFECKLPKAFKDFYLVTNGGDKMNRMQLFCYDELAKLENIIDFSKTRLEYCMPEGYEPYFNSSKPMAFATDENSRELWLNFDNNLEDKATIIETDLEFGSISFVANSFEEFLNNVAERMENPENASIRYTNNTSYPYSISWEGALYETLRLNSSEKEF